MDSNISKATIAGPWNKGRLVGQKLLLKLREIWAICIRLQLSEQVRDLALFYLAIDSKLRGCDLVSLRVKDISQGRSIFYRAIVMQRKTSRPVQFEITEQTRQSVLAWVERRQLSEANTCSQAGLATLHICLLDSMHASLPSGWNRSDWMPRRTVHIRCGERKRL